MRLLALCLVFVTGCYDRIAISAEADMTCFYEDVVVWSGKVSLDGMGLSGFEDRLTGEWTFYKTPEGRVDASTRCELKVQATE